MNLNLLQAFPNPDSGKTRQGLHRGKSKIDYISLFLSTVKCEKDSAEDNSIVLPEKR